MLFRRREKRGVAPYMQNGEASGFERPQLYRIDLDMMLKGSVHKRRKGVVRQYGVTVNGSTKLVTSGDIVDRETYLALLAAGAIRPIAAENPQSLNGRTPLVVDHPASGSPEE